MGELCNSILKPDIKPSLIIGESHGLATDVINPAAQTKKKNPYFLSVCLQNASLRQHVPSLHCSLHLFFRASQYSLECASKTEPSTLCAWVILCSVFISSLRPPVTICTWPTARLEVAEFIPCTAGTSAGMCLILRASAVRQGAFLIPTKLVKRCYGNLEVRWEIRKCTLSWLGRSRKTSVCRRRPSRWDSGCSVW